MMRVARLMQLHFQQDVLCDLALMAGTHLCDTAVFIRSTGSNPPCVSWVSLRVLYFEKETAHFVPTLNHHSFTISWFSFWQNYQELSETGSLEFPVHTCSARIIFAGFSTAIWHNSKLLGEKDLLLKTPELHSSSPANISWERHCTVTRLTVLAAGHCLLQKYLFHSSFAIDRCIPK